MFLVLTFNPHRHHSTLKRPHVANAEIFLTIRRFLFGRAQWIKKGRKIKSKIYNKTRYKQLAIEDENAALFYLLGLN